MKRLTKLLGIIVIGTVIGMAGCDTGTTDNGNDDNSGNNNNTGNNNNGNNNNSGGSPFVGTWIGTVQGAQATIVISSGNTWSLSVPAGGFTDSGSYSGSGSVATLTSNGINGGVVGTATATVNVDGTITTITLVLNQNSVAPGTYTLTKQ
jgi:hypothetical protein